MNKVVRIVLGLFISAICLWYVFKGFDFNDLKAALEKAAFSWLIPAAALYLINQYLRTLRWKIFLAHLNSFSTLSLFPVLILGFFMNTVLPARGGEFVRAFAVHRRFGINSATALGSIVAERMTDLFGLLVIALLSCWVLPIEKLPLRKIIFILFAVGGALYFALTLVNRRKGKLRSSTGLKTKMAAILENLTHGFVAIKSTRKILMAGALSVFIWANEVIYILIISKMMGLGLTFFKSAAVIVGISLGVMVPAAPGFVGTYEFFGTQMLQFLGFEAKLALSFILILHFTQILFVAIVGILSLLVLRKYILFSPKNPPFGKT